MYSVYKCQGTHKKLRIVHQFELYKVELDKFECNYLLCNTRDDAWSFALGQLQAVSDLNPSAPSVVVVALEGLVHGYMGRWSCLHRCLCVWVDGRAAGLLHWTHVYLEI
jgi:hypothetical protein